MIFDKKLCEIITIKTSNFKIKKKAEYNICNYNLFVIIQIIIT